MCLQVFSLSFLSGGSRLPLCFLSLSLSLSVFIHGPWFGMDPRRLEASSDVVRCAH